MSTIKNKRVLYVSTKCGFFGGVERYIYDTASLLAASGWSVAMVYEEKARDFETFSSVFSQTLTKDQLDQLAEDDFTLAYIHKVDDPELLAAVREKFVTVVFVHDHDYYCLRRHKYFPIGRKNCHLPFNRFYCTLCSGMVTRGANGLQMIDLKRRFKVMEEIKLCDAFVVMSGFMRSNLIQNGFPVKSIYKLYPVRQLPEALGYEHTVNKIPTVVYVGQLIKGKGVDLLLQALSRVKVDFKAFIVGGDNEENALRELSVSMRLDKKVEFVGWSSDPGQYLQQADVAVVPSRWQEPFGLTGPEAFAYSLPVVSFDVGGISEWLRNGRSGILVPEGDIDGFAAAIERLLSNRELAVKYGEYGRYWVEKHLSGENFIAGFNNMCERITGNYWRVD